MPLPPKFRRAAGLALIPILLASLAWWVVPWFMPLPKNLLQSPSGSGLILDRHGIPLAHLTLPDSTRSLPVGFSDLPRTIIDCTLAAEDKRFFSHGGVDLLATIRAIKDLIAHREIISGASTITQQLIKISSTPARRTPLTKIRESLTARHLEMKWSKEEILTAYLNRLDYGNRRIGIAEAARFHFQKPLADLSLAEAALLAGLPQSPSRLNPLRHPQRAIKRRDTVLQRLAAEKKYDATNIRNALAEPLALRPLRENQNAPWIRSISRPQSNETTTRCTIDATLQNDFEKIVSEETAKLKDANLRHAALVCIHNPTGEILALVSSANWHDPRGGQFNGALTPRSPGSTLKPFTYLLAMQNNQRTPASIIADIPSPYRTPQGLDLPENYDRKYRGPVTLRAALACSLNIPAMRELNALGGPAILHQTLLDLGLKSLGDNTLEFGLGLTLGNAPVRLLELTNAYATLARLGRHLDPTLYPEKKSPPAPSLSLSQSSAYLIADILSDPNARAPSFPPGGPLDLPFRCAMKTGTSSNYRDNWCIGYTPEFTIGVWAGNFENQPMKNLSGIAGAAPIFHRAMIRLHQNQKPTWFTRPAGLMEITIDARNGKLIQANPQNPHARTELVPTWNQPAIAIPADYDDAGRALLNETYADWFASPHNHRQHELALNPSPDSQQTLRIISPADGTTLLIDPDIPTRSHHFRPVTNLPGTARWSSSTLRIESAQPEPLIHLSPGTHQLTATNPRNGRSQTITIHVKRL
ncbi:MAG: penicillin-binding protein 1C [Verrucomicrobia bacterium]|nr:penicillin-binding protein 1C [Verrucomicrobiota bacterium]